MTSVTEHWVICLMFMTCFILSTVPTTAQFTVAPMDTGSKFCDTNLKKLSLNMVHVLAAIM